MFRLNKYIKLGICGFAILGLIGMAAVTSQALEGTLVASGTLTDGDTTMADNTTMDITLSPGVAFQYFTSDTAYTLSSQNQTTVLANRNEYGVSSAYAGYYMRPATGDDWVASATASNLSAVGTGDFDGWTQQ